jgi:dolichol kinase
LELLLGDLDMVFQSDLIGVLSVYVYVIVLLIITEKILSKKYPIMSRKILHIMVGNIAFLLPIFQTREVMAFIAAGPFIIFTFLMSPYTPIKSISGKTSSAGHGMGLVYYSITWTILAYLFFDNMVVIAIGIFAMSYGDGFASIIGSRYGLKKYNLFGDQKSYIGSLSMFIFTYIFLIIALLYYNIEFSIYIILLLGFISLIGTIIEGITPKGLDNLFVPFVVVFLYWFFLLI